MGRRVGRPHIQKCIIYDNRTVSLRTYIVWSTVFNFLKQSWAHNWIRLEVLPAQAGTSTTLYGHIRHRSCSRFCHRDLNAVWCSDSAGYRLNIMLYWPYVAYHCRITYEFLHEPIDKCAHRLQLHYMLVRFDLETMENWKLIATCTLACLFFKFCLSIVQQFTAFQDFNHS